MKNRFFTFISILSVIALYASLIISENIAISETGTAIQPENTAKEEISEVINELVVAVQANPGKENRDIRREEMRKIISPRFDFQEMSRRSLGKEWRTIDAEQQKEFIDVFSDLLAKTYLNRIEHIKPGMVETRSERASGPKALVKTMVTYKGDTFPLDYKLINKEGQWKVYDVIIENIGLIANYRHEFSATIRKKKFSGLMSNLRKKLAEPDKK